MRSFWAAAPWMWVLTLSFNALAEPADNPATQPGVVQPVRPGGGAETEPLALDLLREAITPLSKADTLSIDLAVRSESTYDGTGGLEFPLDQGVNKLLHMPITIRIDRPGRMRVSGRPYPGKSVLRVSDGQASYIVGGWKEPKRTTLPEPTIDTALERQLDRGLAIGFPWALWLQRNGAEEFLRLPIQARVLGQVRADSGNAYRVQFAGVRTNNYEAWISVDRPHRLLRLVETGKGTTIVDRRGVKGDGVTRSFEEQRDMVMDPKNPHMLRYSMILRNEFEVVSMKIDAVIPDSEFADDGSPGPTAEPATQPSTHAPSPNGVTLNPNIAFDTTAGRPIRLGDYRGRVVVMEFWSRACIPCRQATARSKSAAERYRDEGVVFLTVNIKDTLPVASQTAAEWGLGDTPVLLDADGLLGKQLGGVGYYCIVLDGAGTVRWLGQPGTGVDDPVDRAIRKSMAKPLE